MERISVFDMFKIGVGPSSSHTMGPWRAALDVLDRYGHEKVKHIQIKLFGSLAKTGIGHGTDLAVILGLCGHDPELIDTAAISFYLQEINSNKQLKFGAQNILPFDSKENIQFLKKFLPAHPNAVRFIVKLHDKREFIDTYYSIGGGFIKRDGENIDLQQRVFPFPIDNEKDLMIWVSSENTTIDQIVWANELSIQPEDQVKKKLMHIWHIMEDCIYQGCHTEGILPGGLSVQRRAFHLNKKLLSGVKYNGKEEWIKAVKGSENSFANLTRWISCFALAVNEENAAFSRVVTAPTNGAAGVIPAVLMYYLCFCEHQGEDDIIRFLLTAGEIGSLFKKGSTISAAMGGCQAEIGVSSSMAAAGLTACQDGSPQQVVMAAEIAMEHHLGLTCDPINGLVQIPCIERNTMGAMKAITASQLALSGDFTYSKIRLDGIIKTMWETAKDMHRKYKETSEGGLARHISVMLPEC
ncbi:MAG: L-serine ammonia-lyase [Saprospiraceae bacterium]|nr:L-serine ammonia-lyase [Saprospiraceae bacterium]